MPGQRFSNSARDIHARTESKTSAGANPGQGSRGRSHDSMRIFVCRDKKTVPTTRSIALPACQSILPDAPRPRWQGHPTRLPVSRRRVGIRPECHAHSLVCLSQAGSVRNRPGAPLSPTKQCLGDRLPGLHADSCQSQSYTPYDAVFSRSAAFEGVAA